MGKILKADIFGSGTMLNTNKSVSRLIYDILSLFPDCMNSHFQTILALIGLGKFIPNFPYHTSQGYWNQILFRCYWAVDQEEKWSPYIVRTLKKTFSSEPSNWKFRNLVYGFLDSRCFSLFQWLSQTDLWPLILKLRFTSQWIYMWNYCKDDFYTTHILAYKVCQMILCLKVRFS